jgi:hypothetical protein
MQRRTSHVKNREPTIVETAVVSCGLWRVAGCDAIDVAAVGATRLRHERARTVMVRRASVRVRGSAVATEGQR